MPVLGGSEIARLFVTLGADITEYNNKLDAAMSKMRMTGKGFQDAGRMLSKWITLPLTIAAGVAFKASVDFESAFAGVRKTVNATEEEFAQFRKGILEMSKVLPSSANEIANVAEIAGQLGVQNEALLDFTRTMIDLGETTNLSANEAATALARMMNIMGSNQNDVRKFGSAIVELGNNLATTEAEIAEMALRLAGAATQVGLTEGETLGLAAALSSLGLRADAGGTAFSKVFIEISKAVATGSDELANFAQLAGMTIDEFKTRFKDDAIGAVLAFVKGLGQVEAAGGNVFTVLDALGIQERRMVDALLRTANASDLVTRSVEMGSKAIVENTALTEEANKRYETTAAQLEMARNQATAAAIAIGDNLKDAVSSLLVPLKGVFATLEEAAKKFNELPTPVRMAVGAVVALTAAIGPMLLGLGALTKILPLVTLGFNALTTAVNVSKAAMLAHPVVAIIAALVGMFAVFFYQVKRAREEVAELERQTGIASRTIKDQSAELATWSRQALLARKAMIELSIAQKESALSMARIQSAMVKGDGPNAYAQQAHDLLVELTQLKAKLAQTEDALNATGDAAEDAAKKTGELAKVNEEAVEAQKTYEEGMKELSARSRIMGDDFNGAKEEVGLLEEYLVSLIVAGIDPASERIQVLIARLDELRDRAANFDMKGLKPKGADQPTNYAGETAIDEALRRHEAEMMRLGQIYEDAEQRADQFKTAVASSIAQGMTDAASAFAEGVARMAMGKERLGGVISAVMSTLGDMAIRVGKIAIGTGIAIEKIKASLTALQGVGAIAAGIALIALGSFVKGALSSAASGGGGGYSSTPTEVTSLTNYNPSLPSGGYGSASFPTPASGGDGSSQQSGTSSSKTDVNVKIEPSVIPSGDIEYSVREGARRADRYGTEVM